MFSTLPVELDKGSGSVIFFLALLSPNSGGAARTPSQKNFFNSPGRSPRYSLNLFLSTPRSAFANPLRYHASTETHTQNRYVSTSRPGESTMAQGISSCTLISTGDVTRLCKKTRTDFPQPQMASHHSTHCIWSLRNVIQQHTSFVQRPFHRSLDKHFTFHLFSWPVLSYAGRVYKIATSASDLGTSPLAIMIGWWCSAHQH